MAINITKAGGKTAQKALKTPTKATMNFARREGSFNWKKMLPLLLAIVVVALVFMKFGIIDQTARKIAAYNKLSDKQTDLAAQNMKLAGYDELHDEYGRYSYGWMTEAEVNLVDRMDVLKLIEKYIMPKAEIENFSVKYNELALNLNEISLEQAKQIVKEIEQDELVEEAFISQAKSEDGKTATVLISITLTGGEDAAATEEA